MAKRGRGEGGLERRFEGKDTLQGLLELTGSPCDVAEVAARIAKAQAAGQPASAVFPTLFDGEPRFPDPSLARALYGNLFGLWDLLAEGRPWDHSPREKPDRPKRVKPVPPTPFAPGAPDEAYVEAAWRYLEDLPAGDPRAHERLRHAFDNRQDALLGFLDELGWSDQSYGVARHLLFELHAMIELGWPQGLKSLARFELEGAPSDAPEPPAPLQAYADEALFEAEQDEESPLAPEEAVKVRGQIKRWLAALWGARRD